jgi:predicted transcriptional regulator
MRNTIMTEKIVRRGVRVPSDYAADYLDQIYVRDACSREIVSLQAEQTIGEVRAWLASAGANTKHQGFPVVSKDGGVLGVVTRRQLYDNARTENTAVQSLITRAPLVVREDHTLREAADHMVESQVGRLIVVSKHVPHRMVGIITRGDLLAAHAQRLKEAREASRHLDLGQKAASR